MLHAPRNNVAGKSMNAPVTTYCAPVRVSCANYELPNIFAFSRTRQAYGPLPSIPAMLLPVRARPSHVGREVLPDCRDDACNRPLLPLPTFSFQPLSCVHSSPTRRHLVNTNSLPKHRRKLLDVGWRRFFLASARVVQYFSSNNIEWMKNKSKPHFAAELLWKDNTALEDE